MLSSHRTPSSAPLSHRPLWRFFGGSIVVAILLGSGWYFFFIKEVFQDIQSTSEPRLQELRTRIDTRNSELKDLERNTRQFAELGSRFPEQLDRALPSDTQLPELWYGIRGLVGRMGLHLENIEFSGSLAPSSLSSTRESLGSLRIQPTQLTIDVSRVGYEQLKQLIRTLAQHIRVVEITSLQYTASESRARIGVTVYSIPPILK